MKVYLHPELESRTYSPLLTAKTSKMWMFGRERKS